jgi:uncharacterized membrane protein
MPNIAALRRTAYGLIATAGLLITSISAAHAEINLCNSTTRTIFVTYQAPADDCDTGSRQDHILMAGGSCVTVGVGSSKNQSLYYFAVDQNDPDAFWAGDIGIWVPSVANRRCTPEISCHPSSGDACGDGSVYNMREHVGTRANYKFSFVE